MAEEKKKQYPAWTDRETHTELAVMAARKKTSIGKVLKELVAREKFQSVIMDPRQWTKKMSDAWHSNIPDIQKAFEALRKAAE